MILTNKELLRKFKRFIDLMELHQLNSFKIKAYQKAIYQIQYAKFSVGQASETQLKEANFTQSITEKIGLLKTKNTFPELEELTAKTPKGLFQILKIHGIGAKKVRILWQELGVENIDTLKQVAINQQVEKLKGFGKKTQSLILNEIAFLDTCRGWTRYADAEPYAQLLLSYMKQHEAIKLVDITGEFRRNLEVVSEIQIIVATNDFEQVEKHLNVCQDIDQDAKTSGVFVWRGKFKAIDLRIEVKGVDPLKFYNALFVHSANIVHLTHPVQEDKNLLQICQSQNFESEHAIYNSVGLSYVPPELRENTFGLQQVQPSELPRLIELSDLKGVLHNHSTYSDGAHTLEEMATACRDLGYEYVGISDHSKTAVYANGLDEYRIQQQHHEIDLLNKKLAPFKIFKGIESDILADGSLDYTKDTLATFDFVVASIHSGLNMTKEQATERILKAIYNPYTTILGHPTGRLLLQRKGYEIDYERIFEACAEQQVVVEINANPRRLDLDWRQIQSAIKAGVTLSINPDAHHRDQYHLMRYGVLVARKGRMEKHHALNSMNIKNIATYFSKRKHQITTV